MATPATEARERPNPTNRSIERLVLQEKREPARSTKDAPVHFGCSAFEGRRFFCFFAKFVVDSGAAISQAADST